jgi:outer membrane protein assembly factor BamE
MVTIRSTHVKSRPTRRGVAALVSAALLMAGCSTVTDYFPRFLRPYRPDVQQGNVITSDMVDQLRPGMTRDQVKFMLGTPLLHDGFHPDRWDYLYYLRPRVGTPQRRNLVIYFKDNRLERFTSDPMPPESMADNLILGRKAPVLPSRPPKASEPPKESAPQGTAGTAGTAPASEPPKESAPQDTAPASEPSGQPAPPATPPASSQ